ncbi:MAG: helix-turn-helix domain-containing protein [Patescibacteria group bacterium]
MAKDIQKLLSDVGLLPSESKVYLSTLELGPSTVVHIATKAGISRTAAYEAIEMLQNRGLMSTSTVGKRTLYSSEDPQRIVSYLKGEQQRFAATLSDIEGQVSVLSLLSGGIRPTVKVYEGEEALPAYFDHVAQVKPKNFDEVTNLDDVYTNLGEETIKKARASYDVGKLEAYRILHHGAPRNLRAGVEIRELTKKFGDFHGNISIYNQFVTFVTYSVRPVAVIVESAIIADTMRTLFNAAWEASGKKE